MFKHKGAKDDNNQGSWMRWQFFRKKRKPTTPPKAAALPVQKPIDDLVYQSPKLKKNIQNEVTKQLLKDNDVDLTLQVPIEPKKVVIRSQAILAPRPVSQSVTAPTSRVQASSWNANGSGSSPMCRSRSDYHAQSGRSPGSALVHYQLDSLLKARDNPSVVCAGLVKSRAQKFEAKIAENEQMRESMKFQPKREVPEKNPVVPPHQGLKPSVMTHSNISSMSTTSERSTGILGLLGSTSRSSFPPTSSSGTSKEISPLDESKDRSRTEPARGPSSTMSACPSESEHNFLIDDEYKDQPDLTLHEELESELSDISLDFHDLGYDHFNQDQGQRSYRHDNKKLSRALFFDNFQPDYKDYEHRSDFMSRFRKNKTGSESAGSSGLPIGPASTSGHSQRQNIPSSSSSGRGFHIWRRSKERSTSLSSEDSTSTNGGGCRCREVMNLSQDIMSIKTYLHKLRRILQEADTSTPGIKSDLFRGHGSFDASFSSQLSSITGVQSHEDEMNDLKREVAYLQQQNVEKDRMIKQLQRHLDVQSSPRRTPSPVKMNNAATQTERPSRALSCGVSLGSDAASIPSSSGSEKSRQEHSI
ncbi:uncharacterized protein LOC131892128 isoform X2 [Tigriopus californicus]|uniref:uncharacterized protein LOC131892128 isoform X2 n=1 Tax=Tigriopus californicus TaxID=6832 RepID=UPI0027DA4A47|nr:uncharacterized protein LOC131892128 isoform X2 [Tigriopus californicus]